MRCFEIAGEGASAEINLEGKERDDELTDVWKMMEDWIVGEGHTAVKGYVALTSDLGLRRGLDLREWTENGWFVQCMWTG